MKSRNSSRSDSRTLETLKKSPERFDLEFLLLNTLLVPFVWFAVYGWRFSLSVAGHDAIPSLFTSLESLREHHGDWTQYLYRLDLAGGVKVHDLTGVFPIYELGSFLGFSSMTNLNLSVFLIQICYGFLAMHTALDLAWIWRSQASAEAIPASTPQVSLASQIGLAAIFSFAPVLAWRLAYGHFSLFAGNFAYVCAVALLIAALAERMTLTLLAVSVVALAHCFPISGQQCIAYGAIFGAPILLGLLSMKRPSQWDRAKKKGLGIGIAVLVGSFALVLPKFVGLLFNALSSDTSRNLSAPQVTYSFITAALLDWISSIPWANELIPSGRIPFHHHETNYAFGPLLLLLGLVPWRRAKGLGVGLLLSVFFAITFSMDVEPISTLLIKCIPILKSFRVPERAIFPFALTLPILGCAALFYRYGSNPSEVYSVKRQVQKAEFWVAIIAAVIVLVLPIEIREGLSWLIVAVSLGLIYVWRTYLKVLPISLVFLILGAASVSAFQERILPFIPAQAFLDELKKIGSELASREPDLLSPLTRVHLNYEEPNFNVDTGYAMGLSTLDAYWVPTGRFLALDSALKNEPVNPTVIFLMFPENSPSFPVMHQLYNLKFIIDNVQNTLTIRSAGETAGRAWFSGAIQRINGIPEMARMFKESPSVSQLVKRQLWLDQTDPKVQKISIPETLSSGCQDSKILSAEAERGGQSVHLTVENSQLCPLTVAMNYAENLRAFSSLDKQELTLFPAYGALASVLVPPGVKAITIEAFPVLPLWARLGQVLGLLILVVAFWMVYSSRQGSRSVES